MHTDPNKLLALERALHQIDQLKARQPASGLIGHLRRSASSISL